MKTKATFGLNNTFGTFRGIKLAVIVIIGFSLLLTVAARTAQENSDSSGDVNRVMSLETLCYQAEVARDARAMAHLLTDKYVPIDIDGSSSTKAEFLASMTSGPALTTGLINESREAYAYANTVIVIGVYREKVIRNGKSIARRGRFMDTWVKVDNAWLCAASQSTLIQK